MRSFWRQNTLLVLSLASLLIFSLLVFLDTSTFYEQIERASLWVRRWFGTFYLYLGLFCVLFILIVALSPLGKRKLGKPTDQPEHSTWGWIAMLYSAGMGAGILLRAVQEPVYMKLHPPLATGIAPNVMALEYTFYQWGFTAWAFYGLFAIVIGYYLFVKEKTSLVSTIIEDKTSSVLAIYSIDLLAVITTVFGLMGAIGLGTTQINGGLTHLYDQPLGIEVTIALTLLISLLAFVSVWSGINKGIRIISKINILVTLLLFLFIFFQTDLAKVFSTFIQAFYHYLVDFIPLSLAYGKFDPGEAFLTDWTYYYWAFWLAWAPFTGIFIARISRGRTLREILIGVLLIPSLGTFFWFSVFGDTAFQLIDNGLTSPEAFSDVFSSIFVFFQNYPLQGLINSITIFLLISFLVTSVDSAVFVLSMFTDGGRAYPSRRHRLIWSVAVAIFAVALLILGNARPDTDVLIALQKLLIITSLPFSLFMVLMTVLFLRDFLKKQPHQTKEVAE